MIESAPLNVEAQQNKKVKTLWSSITSVLDHIATDGTNPQKRTEASGTLDKMWTFDFVFHLEVLLAVL
jgi:hypothetical protein